MLSKFSKITGAGDRGSAVQQSQIHLLETGIDLHVIMCHACEDDLERPFPSPVGSGLTLYGRPS